ncbi:MAG: SIS domain-containing protein [Clostridiales bacterium]|jgi:glucosamine 6-phosphate synthetase-like amidotransferase/phosphosugar isomerase protein|nr:SIS domain-containing protein [Clostridiales bacterium]
MKVSLLDCIERTPVLLDGILADRARNFAPLLDSLGESGPREIVLVGSGTSNTASVTARFFIEKVTKLRTIAVYPNDFLYHTHAYNPDALYVFVSQTGTSSVVRQAQKAMLEKGFKTASITESPETPLAKESPVCLDMGCGIEEYLTRTIGYSASVFTLMLLGLEIARRRGTVSKEAYAGYIKNAAAVGGSQRRTVSAAMTWMDRVKRSMLRSQCVVFTGTDALQGVALEAAVKVWEIPQIISIGYELEEGMHGPNFGYNHNHCVVVLNHGGRDSVKGLALARWMRDIYGNGFVIGSDVVGEQDLKLDLTAGDFDCLEITPAVQVLAYRLAYDQGRDLYAPHDNSVMNSYFNTHAADGTV